MSDGISPVKLFSSRIRNFRFARLPMNEGMLPLVAVEPNVLHSSAG